MNANKRTLRNASTIMGIASISLLGTARNLHAENFSDPTVNQYWAESWTDSTDTYQSPDQTKNVVVGGQLVASIPTDGNPDSPDIEVVNYVRTRSDLPGASAYYSGSLLGNLSGTGELTATFSLNNSALAPGEQFQASEFVGEGTGPQMTSPPDLNDPSGYTYNSGTPSPQLRLVFTGSTPDLTDDPSGNTPNEWWSTGSNAVFATSIDNGQDVTLTVSFDPSDWSNYDGKNGALSPAYTNDFNTALSDVSLLGISFGSGDFYSDGFSFDTPGGIASLDVSNISTVVPEPASFSVLGLGALALLRRRRPAINT